MMTRRRFVVGLGSAAGLLASGMATAHNDAGRVLPRIAGPGIPLVMQDGRRAGINELLSGRVTALQMMFATCSSTCPIQGALFGAVQKRIESAGSDVQLVSLTIDPVNDDPQALTAWLAKHGGTKRWVAGTPALADLDRWMDFLRARSLTTDRHTGQVYLFDRRARLAMRTVDFPGADQVAAMLNALAREG